MTLALRHNTDRVLPASHTIEIAFKLPPVIRDQSHKRDGPRSLIAISSLLGVGQGLREDIHLLPEQVCELIEQPKGTASRR